MKYNLDTLNNLWIRNKNKPFIATRFSESWDCERHDDYEIVCRTPDGQFAIRDIGSDKCKPGLVVGDKRGWYFGKAKKTYEQAYNEKQKKNLNDAKKTLKGNLKISHLNIPLVISTPKLLANSFNLRLEDYCYNKRTLEVPLVSLKESRKLKRALNKWTDKKLNELTKDINSHFQNELLVYKELVKACPRIENLANE